MWSIGVLLSGKAIKATDRNVHSHSDQFCRGNCFYLTSVCFWILLSHLPKDGRVVYAFSTSDVTWWLSVIQSNLSDGSEVVRARHSFAFHLKKDIAECENKKKLGCHQKLLLKLFYSWKAGCFVWALTRLYEWNLILFFIFSFFFVFSRSSEKCIQYWMKGGRVSSISLGNKASEENRQW